MEPVQKRGLEETTTDSQLVHVAKKARNDEVIAFAGETLRDRQLMAAVSSVTNMMKKWSYSCIFFTIWTKNVY